MHEARIWVGVAVHDRNAAEPHPFLHPLRHQPDRGADLVVRVAGADNPCGAGWFDGFDVGYGDVGPCIGREDGTVRISVARHPDIHQKPAFRGECAQELGFTRGEVRQQVNDHRPNVRAGTGTQRVGRGGQ